MKSILLFLLSFLLFSCSFDGNSNVNHENEITIAESPVLNDSAWIIDKYTNGNLSVIIVNHSLKNMSIRIKQDNETTTLDLNELKIPFKTPEVDWVSDEMICISSWWSGPFGRSVFIPLNGELNEYIYIDKDIELTDSATNTVVYVDTVIQSSKIVLGAENLLTRKKKLIELKIPTNVDLYPFYDSLTVKNSELIIWFEGGQKNIDIKILEQ